MMFLPLKALRIGRHPSLPERSSPTSRSEPGLDPDEAVDLFPVGEDDGATGGGRLPDDADRSGRGMCADRRTEKGGDSDGESGDPDEETYGGE